MKNPNGKAFYTYLGMLCHSSLDLRSIDLDLLDLSLDLICLDLYGSLGLGLNLV